MVTLLVALAVVGPALAQEARLVTVEHVTIIDPTALTPAEARISDQTVLIAGNRVRRVGPAGTIPLPDSIHRIDGRGKFLLPGFWDMHVHFNRDPLTRERVMGPLMIAHGVTSVRDMLSDCWEPCATGRLRLTDMRAVQQRVATGEVLAPRLQALSSAIVRGPTDSAGYPAQFASFWQPGTEEQGRQLARFFSARGVDLIKTYHSVPRAAYLGLLDEARSLGIPVAGHHPPSIDPAEAARHGVRSIEHARFPALACNPEFDDFSTMFGEFAAGMAPFRPEVFARLRDATTRQFEPERCARIFEALVAADTYLDPTHLTRQMDARAADSSYRNDPRRAYVPSWRLQGWDRDLSATAGGTPELLGFYRDLFDLGLHVTAAAHAAGVKILVGTDAFDTMVFPGFSYHDELALLSRAGLTPLEILRAAAYRGPEFLGKTANFGTVADGKLADLVLLSADPLVDIRNTTQIDAVIFDGVVRDRVALDAMIGDVRDFVARADRWQQGFASQVTPLTGTAADSLITAVQALVPRVMGQSFVPGVSVALVVDYEVVWHGAFGVANIDTGEPVDSLTLFGGASLDKPLFAYAALKLADRGMLDLDRPLLQYAAYPDLAGDARASRITARHALSHTAGLPNWRRRGALPQTLFEPGRRFSYSGEGMAMLSAVLTQIVERPIDQWLRDEVFLPLGMTDTHLGLSKAARAHAATGHDPKGRPSGFGLQPPDADTPFPAPLFTTAKDYAAFLAALLHGEGLSPEARAALRTPVVQLADDCLFNCTEDGGNPSIGNFWGLGWGMEAPRSADIVAPGAVEGVTLWQWGDSGRYQAFAAADPTRGIGFVVLTNGRFGDALREPLLELILPGPHPGLAWLVAQYARLAARAGSAR